jgi:hypothetical protein
MFQYKRRMVAGFLSQEQSAAAMAAQARIVVSLAVLMWFDLKV